MKRSVELRCDFAARIGCDRSTLREWMHDSRWKFGDSSEAWKSISAADVQDWASQNRAAAHVRIAAKLRGRVVGPKRIRGAMEFDSVMGVARNTGIPSVRILRWARDGWLQTTRTARGKYRIRSAEAEILDCVLGDCRIPTKREQLPGRSLVAEEIESLLGINKACVRLMARHGLPRDRLGSKLLFDPGEVAAFHRDVWPEIRRKVILAKRLGVGEEDIARVDGDAMAVPITEAARRTGLKRSTIRRWFGNAMLGCERDRNNAPLVVIDAVRKISDGLRLHKERTGRRFAKQREDDHGPGFIYGLTDPRRANAIRYIGKTINVKNRRRDYNRAQNAGYCHSPPLKRWFAKLRRDGLRYGMTILETCLFDVGRRERDWIAKGRTLGWKLLNIADGGAGVTNWNGERRATQAERGRRKWADPTYQERHAKAMARRRGVTVDEWLEWNAARPQREADKQSRIAARKLAAEFRKRDELRQRQPFTPTPLTHRGSAFLPLSDNGAWKWAIIDAEDWERCSALTWQAWRRRGRIAPRHLTDGKALLLNRFVMKARAGQMVTIKGEWHDCRKSQLAILNQARGHPRKPRPEIVGKLRARLDRALLGLERKLMGEPTNDRLRRTADGMPATAWHDESSRGLSHC